MKNTPYIEPSIRAFSASIMLFVSIAYLVKPELGNIWLSILALTGLMLLQSGFSKFCLFELILRKIGFRCRIDEIRTIALHDSLTSLPNRLLLEDRAEIAISQARRSRKKVAMMFIDLDNFKQVNDVYGHKTGDKLLISMSQIMQSVLRPYDTLARWGGDEFVVLTPDQESIENIRSVASKLMKAMQTKLLPELDINTTISIGVASFPEDADSTESLLVQADKALFYAKSRGRNNVQIFSEIQETNHGFLNFGLTTRFTEAVRNKQIKVHYQPIIDTETNEISCIEALARWYDEQNGWISPVMFIPLAEDLGLIEELGDQVIENSLESYSNSPLKNRVKLAINISNRQLFSETFLSNLLNKMTRHRISPTNIKFEITESIALDTQKARDTLLELSDSGFQISLDDFGTGFSSLSRLHELPINELKIDMSFVRRITTEDGKIMLQTIVDMGKAMKLNLVAEGVEAEETVYALKLMGVKNLQGYYFSKPKSFHECECDFESKNRLAEAQQQEQNDMGIA